MVRCGRRAQSPPDGLPTDTATGFGSRPGAGPGLKTSLGALLLSTTDDGHLLRVRGAGCPVRFMCARYMRPHWSRSWAEEDSVLELALAPAWPGSRWLRAKYSCPGIEPVRAT